MRSIFIFKEFSTINFDLLFLSYITQKEYAEDNHAMGKGKKDRVDRQEVRTLPFYCCSLSLQPFEDPVCTPEGTIYDIMCVFKRQYHVVLMLL
jgi:hypothetical protein